MKMQINNKKHKKYFRFSFFSIAFLLFFLSILIVIIFAQQDLHNIELRENYTTPYTKGMFNKTIMLSPQNSTYIAIDGYQESPENVKINIISLDLKINISHQLRLKSEGSVASFIHFYVFQINGSKAEFIFSNSLNESISYNVFIDPFGNNQEDYYKIKIVHNYIKIPYLYGLIFFISMVLVFLDLIMLFIHIDRNGLYKLDIDRIILLLNLSIAIIWFIYAMWGSFLYLV